MAKSVGRPVKKSGPAAAKKRAASRKEYQSKTPAERTAIVQSRNKEVQRRADAKRYAKSKTERDTYHREQARKVAGVKVPSKCSSCGSTQNVERHHRGSKVVALCAKCHAKARGYK